MARALCRLRQRAVMIGQQIEETDPKHGDHRQAEKRRQP
jgi:hypothetical protein